MIEAALPAAAISLALGLVLTLPIADIARKELREQRQKNNGDSKYHDDDGTATEESERQYSSFLQVVLIALLALTGSLLCLATAILETTQKHEGKRTITLWLLFGLWVVTVAQTSALVLARAPLSRYRIGLLMTCSFTAECVAACFALRGTYTSKPSSSIAVTTTVLSVLGAIASTTIPRRPDVFVNGRVVDRKSTVSAWDSYTYGWCAPLLKLATTQKHLEAQDLPELEHDARAESLHDSFSATKKTKSRGLLKQLVLSHGPALAKQYTLSIVQSVLLFVPQLVMLQLLRALEARQRGGSVATGAWLWVIGLGFGLLVQGFFESWMWFISYCHLQVPVRMQLSALIFAKAMRRKNVRGAAQETDGDSKPHERDKNGKTDEEAKELDMEEVLQKSQQGTINLVGVDSQRIAEFATYSPFLLATVLQLTVTFTFLGQLVGWQALLAGIALQLATMPLNIYVSKKYAAEQDNLMTIRDQKLAVLNEALNGIRQIKFSALERQWHDRIRSFRDTELKTLWRVFMFDIALIFCWVVGPYMLAPVILGVYTLVYGSLSASVAFTTISLLSKVEVVLAVGPEMVTRLLDAWVSLGRIEKFLNAAEKPKNTKNGPQVSFQNATVTWPSDEEDDEEAFRLREANFSFPNKQLSIVSGRTGSGKSLLLAAVLGEVDIIAGSITVPEAPSNSIRYDLKANRENWIMPSVVAFVSQQPWIENNTLRNNILFGLPFDETRYQTVLAACSLEQDITMLTDGDQTEIGANGINLSGGQRWRVTLARAIYSRAGILVMDDIFSAVDAHVGRHIFEHALTGEVGQGRTRIVVTHHVSLVLPKTDYLVHLENGVVEYSGTVEELGEKGKLDLILKTEETQENGEAETAVEDELLELPEDGQLQRLRSASLGRIASRKSNARTSFSNGDAGALDSKNKGVNSTPRKFVEQETKKSGRVSWHVYKEYLKASRGYWFWGSIALIFVGNETLDMCRSYWLTVWTKSYSTRSNALAGLYSFLHQDGEPVTPNAAEDHDLYFYLWVYVTLSLVLVCTSTFKYFWVYIGSIRASRTLFDKLTVAILHAPLRWLDTVPVGRVLNRFTADFNALDSDLGNGISFLLFHVTLVISISVAGSIATPIFVIFAVVLLAVCIRYALYYLAGARETKRLESVAKSPIFEYFGAALSGVSTIRAFDKADAYVQEMFSRLNRHGRALYYTWLFNRWLGWRLEVISAVFTMAMAALVVGLKGISASLAGFGLSYGIHYSDAVFWLLRQYATVELDMNATERIVEYSNIEIEDQGGEDAPASWPTEGRLEVSNLVVAYAPDLDPVLKGITFSVNANERVGVVGRTGAGKSSLTLALFRFLDARKGTIHIDGIDVGKLKLHDLRSRLAIIPQDPVLFSGTVRSNIDPFDEHEDAALREALERVHLVSPTESGAGTGSATPTASNNEPTSPTANTNVFNSLSSPISEGGSNLSQGQRQLLCLARAIVSRPKVLILDEATSAVDKTTDELIQRSIREEFGNSTMLVIAHRLSTIVDFDRVLVLGEGKVLEYDSPKKLMGIKDGVFKGMIETSGEGEMLKRIIGA